MRLAAIPVLAERLSECTTLDELRREAPDAVAAHCGFASARICTTDPGVDDGAVVVAVRVGGSVVAKLELIGPDHESSPVDEAAAAAAAAVLGACWAGLNVSARSLEIADKLHDLGRELVASSHPGPVVQLSLSKRQHEIGRLLVAGRRNQEIADDLGIGFETAKTQVARLYRKLGVNNRAEAVALLTADRVSK